MSGFACINCGARRNSTNTGPLCNACERKFVAYAAQLPKSKARLTREEWVAEGSPCVSRADDDVWKRRV